MTDVASSVEKVAELMAQLQDPFAERELVLAAVGLDEASWKRVEAQWVERMRAEGRPLAERFAAAFTAARRRPVPASSNVDPRFLSSEAQPWRKEAAAVSLEVHGAAPALLGTGASIPTPTTPAAGAPPPELVADGHETVVLRGHIARPALPFQPGQGPLALALADTEETAASAQRTTEPLPRAREPMTDSDNETAELRVHFPKPALPFGGEGGDEEEDEDEATRIPPPRKC